MRQSLLILSTLLFASTGSLASQALYLDWTDVRIVSAAFKDTGEISFAASLSESAEWKSAEFSAFGKNSPSTRNSEPR